MPDSIKNDDAWALALEQMGPQIARPPISDEVFSRLKKLISRGVFVPGSKLPPERVLVNALGVSRPTLRQTLKVLQILGIVQSRQGSGSYLADSTSEILKVPLEFALLLKRVEVTDLFEARKTIEVKLAELAARRRTEEDLQKMRQALSGMERSMELPDDWCIHEIHFHDCIVYAARNAVMAAIMEMLSNLLVESRRQTIHLLRDYSVSYQSHADVFLAIEKQDTNAASQAMIDHFVVLDQREHAYGGK